MKNQLMFMKTCLPKFVLGHLSGKTVINFGMPYAKLPSSFGNCVVLEAMFIYFLSSFICIEELSWACKTSENIKGQPNLPQRTVF